MFDHDEPTTEELNEQNRALIEELQRLYDARAEDAESLARIRAKVLQNGAGPLPLSQPTPVIQRLPRSSQKRRPNEEPPMPITHPTWFQGKSWRRRLSVIAAAILVTVLVGSLVLLLALRRQGGTATPQSKTPPINIALSSCSSLPWSWQVDLCTRHQFKDLLQWRKMGEYVLVLERAYVDLNQLVMTYRVFSQATGRQVPAELDFPMDTGITTSQGQSFTPSGGSAGPDGPAVAQFNTPPVPKQTQTLQLHVEVNRLRIMGPYLTVAGTPPAPQFTAVPGPTTFDFALEYHGGLVLTPHQTVTVKGLSVTLERVKISASETILEGTTKGTFLSYPDRLYNFSLDAAGRSPGNLSPAFGGESNSFSAVAYDELLGQHGTWTFEISETRSNQAWVFHFRVP